MRIKQNGTMPSEPPITITFNGRTINALVGETISSALHANGVQTLRSTKKGEPRGLYCGMGACFDCVLTVDGRTGVRACMEKVCSGQIVRSEMPAGTVEDPLAPLCEIPLGKDPKTIGIDILIVGAGPAGIAAAISAAQSGAKVIVLDERLQTGGQYFKPLAPSHTSVVAADTQFLNGQKLTENALHLGVQILQDVTVWGADSPNEVIAVVQGTETIFKARQLILATGAYERPGSFDNWTLPGVMTTGAAQTLVRSYKVKPGQRVVIAGNGPLNLQLAVEMVRAGVAVVAVLEAAEKPSYKKWRSLFKAWKYAPSLMIQGLRYVAELRVHGVQVQWGHTVISARGQDKLKEVVYAPVNIQGSIDLKKAIVISADTLCLGCGFIPSTELARAIGCSHSFVYKHLGYLQTDTTQDGTTSVPGVFAIGDGSTLGGASVALARGTLAGLTAAATINKNIDNSVISKTQILLERALKFQESLWEIFKAPPLDLKYVTDKTIACRCEEIDFGQLRAAIEQGFNSLGALKRMTRLGMGRCQGRYCSCTAAKLLNELTGKMPDPEQFFAPRLPAKPVPAGCMAFEKSEWGGHKRSVTPNLARSATTEPLPPQQAEIVIIGAGVMGACLAYFFALEGKDVLIVERDEANFQASGANAGSLHVQLLSFDFGVKAEAGGGPAAQTLPLGPVAIELWRQIEKNSGQDFEISITGGLMLADSPEGMVFLKAKAALERKFGIENAIVDAKTLRNLAPAISHEMIGAEYAPQEGKINPLKATYGVWKAAQSLGARMLSGASVESIKKNGNSWEISTTRCNVSAGIIVNAAGPWSREIGALINIDVPVHSAPLQMIVTESAPVLVKQLVAHADRHLSLKQSSTGGLIIGGGWTAAHNKNRRYNTTLRQSVEGNLWVAQRVLPQLRGLRVLRTWAAMNINIDGAPILGQVPSVPGFYNAVTSNGYTLSPAVAHMTVDLVMGRTPIFDPKPFSIQRFQ
jgi:glycine/D-amino acid oxidase-like deaminating enzyme/bacterioferritin-associated ferredoxin